MGGLSQIGLPGPSSFPGTFDRAYTLTIESNSGSNIPTISDSDFAIPLRITFDVNKRVTFLWWADISIYNLDPNTEQAIIKRGDKVTLQAGYKNGQHNKATIFTGQVFQPMWQRENVVDYKLTLRCFSGMAQDWIDGNYSRYQSQRDIVAQIASSAHHGPWQTGTLDQVLGQTQQSRGGILFGDPRKHLDQIADGAVGPDGNALLHYYGVDGINLGNLSDDTSLVPKTKYAPPLPPGSSQSSDASTDYCIIGDPQQTQEGAVFKILLDPRLDIRFPLDVVQIDMKSTQLNQAQMIFASANFVPPPNPSGKYLVGGLRHYGDTRGNEWYTEVIGATREGILLALGGGH